MNAKSHGPVAGYYAALEEAAKTYPLATEALMRSDRHRLRRWQQFIDQLDLLAMEKLQEFLTSASCSLAGESTTKGAEILPDRIADDLRACLEAIVSGYLQVASNAMRDVMETELLIRDFALDPQLIARWVSADDKTLRRDFQPSACRRRQAAVLGVTLDDLPGALDYKAHSQVLHVTPLRLFARAPEAAGHEAVAVLDQVAEILFHGRSAVEATDALLTAVSQAPLDSKPVLAALSEASSDLAEARAAIDAVAKKLGRSFYPRPRMITILESGLALAVDITAGELDSYILSRTDFRHFGRNISEGHSASFELTPLGVV